MVVQLIFGELRRMLILSVVLGIIAGGNIKMILMGKAFICVV